MSASEILSEIQKDVRELCEHIIYAQGSIISRVGDFDRKLIRRIRDVEVREREEREGEREGEGLSHSPTPDLNTQTPNDTVRSDAAW